MTPLTDRIFAQFGRRLKSKEIVQIASFIEEIRREDKDFIISLGHQVRSLKKQIAEQGKPYSLGEMKKSLAMMKRWLNEDRITDPKKMVTEEDLLKWFE